MSTRAGALLREAAGIVDGPRNATHGDKERSFDAIAGMWTAYLLGRKCGLDAGLNAADVAAMMVLLKFARSEHGQHIADHAVDAAGYAAIWGELREAEADYARARAEKPVQASDTLSECRNADKPGTGLSGDPGANAGHVCAGCRGAGSWWTGKAARTELVSCLDCGGTGCAR